MYYGGGGSVYGGGAYGGAYGGGAYGGNVQQEDSLTGTITLERVLRVCTQHWVTIAVFILVGLLASFAVFKMSPTIYEAVSVMEMSIRRPTIMNTRGALIDGDVGGSMEEVFNTRSARLRSREFFNLLISQYRALHPSAEWTDPELADLLVASKQTLQKKSRLVFIAMRSTDANLATDLANTYLQVVAGYMADQNKAESKAAIAWLTEQAEQEQRKLERVNREILDFQINNLMTYMESQSLIAQEAYRSLSTEIRLLEGRITRAALLNNTLDKIKDEPEKFGELPDSVPRTGEIAAAFNDMRKAEADKNTLLIRLTANHPDVRIKEKEYEVFKQQFADAVYRALETGKANLDLLQMELAEAEPKRNEQMKLSSDLALKIVGAKMKLDDLMFQRADVEDAYQSVQKRIREAQYAQDENTAFVKTVETALPPTKPVLPKPFIIFSAGPFAGLLLGFLFVLIVDHLEDKIVGISDIEQRMRLKALAVFPHVRYKKREQIARLVAEDKFSQFAEAVASLRNLLDSPRYAEMSKVLLCVSTQPGEGKTIASCGLAISCALSGQKTLLIDFDMRRPRIARIFEKHHPGFTSLPHTLVKADKSLFPTLPIASDIANLDLVCSKPSSEISPASLMGSGAIVEFFRWAREHYDRIIVDSPPFGVVGDVMTLSSLVDAVMIMCCPNRTRFNPLKHAARQLAEAGAHVIGAIVNDVDFARHRFFDKEDYHYKYAYQYASKYGYSTSRNAKNRSMTPATAIGSADAIHLAAEDEAGNILPPMDDEDMEAKDMFDASLVDDDE